MNLTTLARAFLIAAVILAIIAMLTGCGTTSQGQAVSIRWIELEEHDLQRTCANVDRGANLVRRAQLARDPAPISTYNGCYDRDARDCLIFTRAATGDAILNPRYQQTLGHEVLHCFRGMYH